MILALAVTAAWCALLALAVACARIITHTEPIDYAGAWDQHCAEALAAVDEPVPVWPVDYVTAVDMALWNMEMES